MDFRFRNTFLVLLLMTAVLGCTPENNWKEIEVAGVSGHFGMPTFFNVDMQKAIVRVSEFRSKFNRTPSGERKDDTVEFYYDSTFTIKPTVFKSFLRKMNSNQLDSNINELEGIICCHCTAYRTRTAGRIHFVGPPP